MVKKNLSSKNVLCILGLVALLVFLYYYFNSPLREGVVFTPYDNSKLFVRPWDKFCVQTPPSCQKDDNYLLVNRVPPIGCWCNDKQKAPLLDSNCTELEFDPFIEYRR